MLTVLMATHNGARTLPRVLDGYCKLKPPDGGWQFVIVNNGSGDNTQEVINSFAPRLPLNSISEPRLGKSIALNTGLETIQGDLLVMTDDDAIPDQDWLVQLRKAADSQPSFAVFGGAIVPAWEAPPPEWIMPLWSVLTLTGPEWEEGPTVMARVSGPNMTVRSEVIERGFRFDTSLGPVGPQYSMGEDTDFVQRLGKAGFKAWYCKGAIVGHIIRKSQMDKKWMLRRAAKLGSAQYIWEYKEFTGKRPALFFGMPRYVVREILEQWVRALRARVFSDDVKAYQERWQLHYLVGRAMGGRILFGENRS